jgi:mRNA-degrading endonuclease YafQ of YafQ-DinJ toxin-antitoxin module
LSHTLLRSSAFVRDSRRLLRKRPELISHLLETLRLLQANPKSPTLKTHKLKGELKKSWACSGGYDLRIVFSFTKYQGRPAILLESVGTHDEVY